MKNYIAKRNLANAIAACAKESSCRDAIAKHTNNSKQIFRLTSTLLDGKPEQPLPSMNASDTADMFSEFSFSKIADIQGGVLVTESLSVATQPILTELHFSIMSHELSSHNLVYDYLKLV